MINKILYSTIIIIPFIVFIALASDSAQIDDNRDRSMVTFRAGVSYINNNTTLPLLKSADNCGFYQSGNALGYYTAVGYHYELVDDFIWIGGNLMLDFRNASLTEQVTGFQVFDPASQNYVGLLREFSFRSDLNYVLIEIGGKFKPMKELPLYFALYFDAGNALAGNNFTNHEAIISPAGIVYPDNSRKRLIDQGELSNVGTSLGLSLGASYEIALKNGLYVSPEFSWRYGINSIISDAEWNMNILRLGIGISMKFGGEKYKELFSPDTIRKDTVIAEVIKINPKETAPDPEPLPNLIQSISANPIELLQTSITQTYPLLPYIFFDSSSSKLKSKYISADSLEPFNEDLLSKETLEIYYKILDIIGSRMSKNPKAKLTLTGTTDGAELQDKFARMKLAENRAKELANYLADRWNIEQGRIRIESMDLPSLPTSSQYFEGLEENRRVEIYSDDPILLSPVVHSRFVENTLSSDSVMINYSMNPNLIRSNNDLENQDKEMINSAEINISAFEKSITTEIELSANSITLDAQELIGRAIYGDSESDILGLNITGTLIAKTSTNREEQSDFKIPVSSTGNDIEVGRLNLIVFDFDKSDITKQNQNMIINFLGNSIKSNSKVKITGSTDRLGEATYNQTLSLSRAEKVRDYISRVNAKAEITSVKGIGANMKYSNDLPEGRFYCRTVLIEVETPIEK